MFTAIWWGLFVIVTVGAAPLWAPLLGQAGENNPAIGWHYWAFWAWWLAVAWLVVCAMR